MIRTTELMNIALTALMRETGQCLHRAMPYFNASYNLK